MGGSLKKIKYCKHTATICTTIMHMMRHIRSIPRSLNPDLPKKLTQRAGHIPTTAKFIRRIQRDHYPALQELFAEVHLWIVLLVF